MKLIDRGLRIAFFVDGTSCASGIDTSTELLAAGLRRQGHTVTFFVPCRRGQAKGQTRGQQEDVCRMPAFRVHTRPDVYWCYPCSVKAISRSLHNPFDVIHVHNATTANLLAWQIAKLCGTPMVYTYHTMMCEYTHYLGAMGQHVGTRLTPTIQAVDRRFCNAADLVTTPSPKAKAYLDEIGLSVPVEVIPNGIDLAQFAPQPAVDLTAKFGLPAGRRLILFVGRLNHEKRPLAAYAAFRNLSQRCPDADLVMAGEGPLRAEIAQRSQADGLADRVHLLGLVPHGEMVHLYNAAYLWLSTSTSEVHPMVAVEATACGLPAVAIADRALEGVVVDHVTGMIVQTEAEMVNCLQHLLDNPAQRTQMSAAARLQAGQFDISSVSRRFCELYLRLARCMQSPHYTQPGIIN